MGRKQETRPRLTREEILEVAKRFVETNGREQFSGREFREGTGISPQTICNHFAGGIAELRELAGCYGDVEQVEVKAVERESPQRRRERERMASIKADVRVLRNQVAELEEREAFLLSIADAAEMEPVEPLRIVPPHDEGNLPAALFLAQASDWHVEERVRPETVSNLNEYSPEIAQERAEQFFKSFLTMMNAARAAWDITQALLWIGGDIITGYIHEEYEAENFLSPTEASLLGFDILTRGISYLLAQSDLEKLIIPTSYGNHGRTGKKLRITGGNRNSYEWMMYKLLESSFADEPRVEFRVANGYHNVVDVYGVRVRFHHGDGISYQGGVGGLSVPVMRRITRQAANDPEPCHFDAFGHLHTYTPGAAFSGNGSLIGWNQYADAKGLGFEQPQQACFVIDSLYKLVSQQSPLIVDKTQTMKRKIRAYA